MLVLLLACAAGPVDETDPGTSTSGEAVDVPPPEPDLDEAGALATLDVGLSLGLPDPAHLLTVYREMMAHGDDVCPGSAYELISDVVPTGGCTSEDGYQYAGTSIWLESDDLGAGEEIEIYLLGGDFAITDPDGQTFDLGGEASWKAQTDGTDVTYGSDLKGTFGYPGGDPWFATGVSAVLQLRGRDRGSGMQIQVSGGLGIGEVDLWFGPLVIDPAVCPDLSPTGTVAVLDPSGAWWTLDYGDACSGCGTLSFPGGEPVETCYDIRGFYEPTIAALRREG